jgi:hypothetical protein
MNRDLPSEPVPSVSLLVGRTIGSRINLLPEDFKPGIDDVICGRGKKCYSHIGNERFRQRVLGMLDKYSQARSKLDKSSVLNDVVEQVRVASPRGGFIKQDEATRRWFEVGDFLAREKTSQTFRDALHEHYKSSSVAKKKRRQKEQAKVSEKLQRGGLADFKQQDPSRSSSDSYLASANEDQAALGILARLHQLSELRKEHASLGLAASMYRLSSHNTKAHPRFSNCSFQRASPETQSGGISMHASSEEPFKSRFDDRGNLRRNAQRSFSLPSSPQTLPTYGFDLELDWLSHSLPTVQFPRNEATDGMEAIHHTLPQPSYTDHISLGSWSNQQALVSPPSFPHYASFGKPKLLANIKLPPVGDGISKDLLSSLEKLTEPSFGDCNPFEPIPLTPIGDLKKPDNLDQAAKVQGTPLVEDPILTDTSQTQKTSLERNRSAFLRKQKRRQPWGGGHQ